MAKVTIAPDVRREGLDVRWADGVRLRPVTKVTRLLLDTLPVYLRSRRWGASHSVPNSVMQPAVLRPPAAYKSDRVPWGRHPRSVGFPEPSNRTIQQVKTIAA
jgi:hypothetical protein